MLQVCYHSLAAWKKHISTRRRENQMLETYTALLTEVSRTLYRNARENKVLYLWFGLMIIFSLVMLAVLAVFMLSNKVVVKVDDILLSLTFVFLFKSSADMHRYFSISSAPTYPLA